jgi:hypothetical protein
MIDEYFKKEYVDKWQELRAGKITLADWVDYCRSVFDDFAEESQSGDSDE